MRNNKLELVDNIHTNLVADCDLHGDILLGYIEDEMMNNWGWIGDEEEIEAEEYELKKQREYELEQEE